MIEFYTSRFGEMIPEDRPETPVLTTLIAMQAEEICFAGRYHGQLGLFVELEFSDENGGHQDMSQETREAWHKIEVPEGVRLATPPPGLSGFGIFDDRAALWAFVPAEIATPELMQHIATEAFRVCELSSGGMVG